MFILIVGDILKNYKMDMTEGPLFSKIVRYSVPIILASLLQLLYNASDIVVVGNFGEPGSIGAVGNTGPLINLIVNVFIGLSVGTCVIIARYYGQKDYESASKAAHTSIVIAAIFGIVVGAIGFLISRPLLELMQTHPDVIDRSDLYMKIYFLGIPGNMMYNFGSAVMKAEGDTTRPLIYLGCTGLINVILNLILVICFDLDVAGVAIATIAAQYISAILVLIRLFRYDGHCKLSRSKLRISKNELIKITQIGLPAGIQGSLFSISNVIIQSSINSFQSPLLMDGNSTAGNLEGFIYVAMNSIAQATLAFVSQNYGALKLKRIDKSIAITSGLAGGIGLVLGLLFCVFSFPLAWLYNKDPQVIAYAQQRMYFVCGTYFLCGIMDVLSSAMRGYGRSTTSMIVSLLGACGFRIIWIFTLFISTKSLNILYLSYPVSWFLTICAHLTCLMITRKREKTKFKLIDT